MKKYLFLLAFIFIFVFGVFLRFYQLGNIPDSLDWDEVASGYNAYSILLTGKDEYGIYLPVTFKSFGDYKPPLYIYTTVPSVDVFGLTAFAVRFPSALFGSLTILSVFFLVKFLFEKEKNNDILSLLSMFFFAISPWSIQFSRGAFEANLALFFVITGATFLIASVRRSSYLLSFIGVILLGISTYGYHSEKLFTSLLLIGICIWGRAFFFKNKRVLALLAIGFLLVCSIWLFDKSSLTRGTSVSFTTDPKILVNSVTETQQDFARGDHIDTLLHNRRFVFINTFFANYLSHFQPNWLFVSGDLQRHHAPGVSLLYLFSLPTILLGMYTYCRRFLKKYWILLFWLILAPIPASLVIQAPHAIRSLVFLPIWQIFEAIGWWGIFFILKGKTRTILASVLAVALFINFFYYLHQYFVHTNTDYQQFWQYGYKEVMQYAKQQKQGNTFVNDDVEQGYIFYLFYNKIDPRQYLSSGGTGNISQKCFTIDNVLFHACKPMRTGDRLISVGAQANPHFNESMTIKYVTGQTAIRVYKQR